MNSDILRKYEVHYRRILQKLGQEFFQVNPDSRLAKEADNFKYVILMYTNRSGSNYLGELLGSTGKINIAKEYLNSEDVVSAACRQSLVSLGDYFYGAALNDGVDGLFAFKASLDHLAILNKVGLLERVLDRGTVIHIERSNKLDQAISMNIASHTGQWASYQDAIQSRSDPEYDFHAIRSRLREVIERSNDIAACLGEQAIPNLCVSYEILVDHPQCIVDSIAKLLEIGGLKINASSVRTRKQAGLINSSWREKYLLHMAKESFYH